MGLLFSWIPGGDVGSATTPIPPATYPLCVYGIWQKAHPSITSRPRKVRKDVSAFQYGETPDRTLRERTESGNTFSIRSRAKRTPVHLQTVPRPLIFCSEVGRSAPISVIFGEFCRKMTSGRPLRNPDSIIMNLDKSTLSWGVVGVIPISFRM